MINFFTSLFFKFVGLFLNEDRLANEVEKNRRPVAEYQCDQCGEGCSGDVHSVPSIKNEHGHRILCNYCWSWRQATKEAVTAGQAKLRQAS
jgi:hypothetical protein